MSKNVIFIGSINMDMKHTVDEFPEEGTNENTNDILRFFYPKGTNFLNVTEEEFQDVIHLINSRPRKCLGYLSPLEFLSKKCCT